MRKRSQVLAGLLSVIVFLCCFSLAALAAGNAGYYVNGQYDEAQNLLTLEVGIDGIADGGVGRFALAFDCDKLTLLEKQGQNYAPVDGEFAYNGVVSGSSVATVTAETLSPNQLISTEDGYVMFAWFATGSKIDAGSRQQPIATMYFALKENVSIDDLDRGTFRLKNVRSMNLGNWNSGAVIKGLSGAVYSSNTLDSQQCEIRFDYPNSTAVPQNVSDVVLKLRDSQGQAVGGSAYIGTDYYTTNGSGNINAEVVPDSYVIKIEAPGYETIVEEIEARQGSKLEKEYILQSDKERLTALADSLEIRYGIGDSANSVRNNLQLPRLSVSDIILTWTSSNKDVIANSGAVARPAQSTKVTMTATLRKGDVVVEKEFYLTVVAKDTLIASTANPGEVIVPGQTTGVKSKFQDLTNVPWAVEAINNLVERGIIKGVSETRFAPQENISRGDFMVLVVRMFNPNVTATDNFSDVPKDSYYYNEIARAKAWGIAKGDTDGTFHPQSPISRQDMMTIMYRALLENKVLSNQPDVQVLSSFTDEANISAYAKEAVEQLVAAKLIQGSGNQIEPLAQTTRAEAAVFLYRILMMMK